MRKVVLAALTLLVFNISFSQTIYTFNGNGNWTLTANWSNNTIPPAILPAGSVININPATGGTCILNTTQTIGVGAGLGIAANAKFVVNGGMSITGSSAVSSVTIGTQVWMNKNLDVTTYRNGDPIPQVTDSAQWVNLTTGAWCYYNNDPANGAIYGKLYNWYAVNDPRGLGPVGWHVPSDAEFSTLVNYLGGESVAGGAMKSINLWNSPNTGATNSSGFAGLPGGIRADGAVFGLVGDYGIWWTITDVGFDNHSRLFLLVNEVNNSDFNNLPKEFGFSIRCVKD
jgi:uncharacterized protein (TIGR02145 family)